MLESFSDEELARRLRFLMDEQGETIKDAAETIGVPYRTLQNQLNGNNKMPASTFAKLVSMLNVPLSFVVSGRVELSHRALANALKEVLGKSLPVVDQEMNVSAPTAADSRDERAWDHHATILALLLKGRYEHHRVDPALIGDETLSAR